MLKLIPGRSGQGTPTLRVLLLEECALTAELLTRELERGGMKFISERVDSDKTFTLALRSFAPEVVFAAPSIRGFTAGAALKLLQNLQPTAPLILVAEQLDEDAAVACLRAGAETIVLRSNLSRLAPAAQKALSVRQPLRKLSRRQLEVLRLVSESNTSKEIAGQLGISIKTVETHRSAAMRRLGIDDVAGLVRYAVRVGLVPQVQSSGTPSQGSGNARLAVSDIGRRFTWLGTEGSR